MPDIYFDLKRKIDDYLKDRKENAGRSERPASDWQDSIYPPFAHTNYESVVEINSVEEPKYKTIVEDGYNPAAVIKNISRIDHSKKFPPGKR